MSKLAADVIDADGKTKGILTAEISTELPEGQKIINISLGNMIESMTDGNGKPLKLADRKKMRIIDIKETKHGFVYTYRMDK